jgi:hypothetical protein
LEDPYTNNGKDQKERKKVEKGGKKEQRTREKVRGTLCGAKVLCFGTF